MIIFDDLSLQTRSDVPFGDWTALPGSPGKARYVVDDGGELASKILDIRVFEPVEDGEGNLIDVVPATGGDGNE
ncbi:MAG: hypothetical protein LBI38_03605 [Oscillospiraceae bacterium]|jgi:hypothetical protein|nr:hypothetical protein [Oscillospiraceae bacterium]